MVIDVIYSILAATKLENPSTDLSQISLTQSPLQNKKEALKAQNIKVLYSSTNFRLNTKQINI